MEFSIQIFFNVIGWILFPFYIYFWLFFFQRSNLENNTPKLLESFGFLLWNLVLHFGISHFTEDNQPIEVRYLVSIANSLIGFSLYFVFSERFLKNESFSVQFFYFFILAFLQIQIFLWVWGSLSTPNQVIPIPILLFSLCFWVLFGYLFHLPHTKASVSTFPHPNESQYFLLHPRESFFVIVSFLLGLFSLFFLLSYPLPTNRIWMGWVGILYSISLSGAVSYFTHRMAGRNFLGHFILLSGMASGFGLFSTLPESIQPLLLLFLGFFAGILPGALGGWVHRKVGNSTVDEIIIFIIFLGWGWGVFLGWMCFPLMDKEGMDIADVFRSIASQFLIFLEVFTLTGFLAGISYGIKKILTSLFDK